MVISGRRLASSVRVVFVGSDRRIWRCLLLYVVTLGIWRRVWLYRINKEMDGHEALGLRHPLYIFLLCLPAGGPLLVNFLTARHAADMTTLAPRPYRAPGFMGLATIVPILGNVFFIGLTQRRLNQFWTHERSARGRGIEVDVDLSADPRFLVEFERAVKESYFAGSRFDQRSASKRQAWARRANRWRGVQGERKAVREAGGSTPVLPWRRAARPARHLLNVTCGRCETAFKVTHDPAAETPIVCPKCGMTEVLPSLRSNPLAGVAPAGVPTVQARCPRCKTEFHAVRDVHGPTRLVCPKCGRADTLAAPEATAGRRGRASSQG
jgi:hypothetical protein